MTDMIRSLTLATAVALSSQVAILADQGRGNARGRGAAQERVDQDGHYFQRHGYLRLQIPPGHYPPPGECRIWYPGRPPGHQPPPGRCDSLATEVPPGAWLIRHPARDREHVHVVVYDERRRGAVLVVGEFEIATGVFARIIVDR